MLPDEKIAHQARNERDIVIGDDVWLGARVFVGAGVTIGDGCVVSANSVVTQVVAAELHRSGEPREDRSQAGGLRRQRTGARARPRHRWSARGEAGRLGRRRDVQVRD